MDYTTEEVREAADLLLNSVEDLYEELVEEFDTLEKSHLTDHLVESLDCLQIIQDDIDAAFHKQNSFVAALLSGINESEASIQNLQATVEDMKTLKDEKKAEFLRLESRVNSLKDKVSYVSEKRELIGKKKDEILTYKVLTKIDFNYSSENIKGRVNKETPVLFNLNPKEVSQNEITNKLWQLITTD